MFQRVWAIAFVIAFSSAAQDAPYQWARTGNLATARHSACAVQLEDGRVLVAGGVTADGPTQTAELYSEDSFQPVAPMQFPRSRHTCTLLPDGRVLVAGGGNITAAEVYDPRDDRWIALEAPITPRAGHTASLLPDGSVLLAGGETPEGPTDLLERYDPTTETIAALSVRLSVPRTRHAAAVLADGRVLIAGGTADGKELLASADLFNPDTASISPAASMPWPQADLSAATLLDGRVFIAGGGEAGTLFYQPDADVFRDGPRLNVPRNGLVALRLPNNGNVLLVGGSTLSDGQPSAATELLDVTRDEIERVGDLTVARTGIAVAPVGRSGVLAIGGERDNAPIAGCGTLIIATITPSKSFYVEGEQARLNINWNQKESVTVNVRKRVNGSLLTELVTRQTVSTLTDPLFILTPALEGNAEVTAVVTGDRSGTTATTTFLVGTAVTTVITRSPSPSLVRDVLTIQVQITGAIPVRGAPAGTLQILDQETRIALLSTSDTTQFQANSTGGIFTFRTSNLAAGSHSLKAFFTRTSGLYASSQSPVVGHTVNKRTPSISVSVSGNRLSSTSMAFLVFGDDPVVLPTGIVSVRNSSGPLGSGGFTTSVLGSNRSLVSIGNLNAGTRLGLQLFSIDYAGDANFNPVSLTRLIEIQRAIPGFTVPAPPTTVPLGASVPLNISFGPLVQLTVDFLGSPRTAEANGTALPTASFSSGPVLIESARIEEQLRNDFDALGNPIGCSPILPFPLADCTRLKGFTTRLRFAAVGSGTVQISYPGDLAYENVTRSFPITVTKGSVSLRLTAVQEGTITSRQVRLTASLTGLVQQFPTGTLLFFDGSTLLQTSTVGLPVLGDTFVSSALVSVPAAGLRTYRIVYLGDANWLEGEIRSSINVQ